LARAPKNPAQRWERTMAKNAHVYPIALDLRGRLAVVVGGGPVAERKTLGLLAAGARVRVVAPATTAELRALADRGELEWCARAYRADDLADARLVYAATNRAEVNVTVVHDARERSILVDDVSGNAAGDFVTPLVHRVGALTFSVETGGSSPSFARRLKGELRAHFDERYGSAADTLRRARDYAKTVVPASKRAAVMAALAGREISELATMDGCTIEHHVDAATASLEMDATPAPPGAARKPLVCATRASALALWQARHVGAALACAGITSTLLHVSSTADRMHDRPLAALGTDSVFVKELEAALRDGRADYAVHSCKDLPSTLPADMHLAAVGARADPRDVFCSERFASFEALPPGARVGTSSPRRRAQLQALRPDLVFETIRGNVDTRLRKLREGQFDAIVLALAGLQRLGVRAAHTVPLAPGVVVPAVGQGALAVETRAADRGLAERIHAAFADLATEFVVGAERAFLRTLRGGCQAPVGAHATYADGALSLRAVIAAPDGSRLVRGESGAAVGTMADCERLGIELAEQLLAEGGEALLAAAVDTRAPGPLAGRVFLLPRTQERPSRIAPAFEHAGAEVVQARDAAGAIAALADQPPDVLLFPSSGSVRAVAPYLTHLHAAGVRPLVASMGPESSAAAREAGFTPDVVATEPSVAAFVQSVTHLVIERSRP
jgi:hydroxymethylbilane synthase